MRAIPAMPPITPPAMIPAEIFFELDSGVTELGGIVAVVDEEEVEWDEVEVARPVELDVVF